MNAENVNKKNLNKSLSTNRIIKGLWMTANKKGRVNDTSYPPVQDPNFNEFVSDSKQKACLFKECFLSRSAIISSKVKSE